MYELIAHNRRMSWMLIIASFVLLWIVAASVSAYTGGGKVGLVIGVAVAGVMTFAAYWKSDSVALAATRAQPASIDDYPQLHNIVEALSISAGIPKPRVYVVHDPAPNAFATGRDPEHAAIAVTTGLMQIMNRAELEGVIAHELSHVRNYDIRVTTLAVATAGAVALICDIFLRFTWWGGSSRRNNNNSGGANPLMLILSIVVILLAPLAAGLIKAAVSRKREALADASAVEITRYPTGLRQALEKLAGNKSVVAHASTATAHLWIESPLERGNAKGGRFNSMFDTHPPLEDRINTLRALEGLDRWDGVAPDTSRGSGFAVTSSPHNTGYQQANQSGASATPGGPPPGWYSDPSGRVGVLRFWNGTSWTNEIRRA